jgi:hypothetical protein
MNTEELKEKEVNTFALLKDLSEECTRLSDLLTEIQEFNGPKFIRVFLLWGRCVNAGVSPFITRGELKLRLDCVYNACIKVNTDALMLFYINR